MILATSLASILASCAPSTRFVASPSPAPPESLIRPCEQPRRLSTGALSASEVARLWGRDRVALAACAGRQEALARFAQGLAAPGR
jgi:hypothetical protein